MLLQSGKKFHLRRKQSIFMKLRSVRIILLILISIIWFGLNLQKFFFIKAQSSSAEIVRENFLVDNYLKISLLLEFKGEKKESEKFLKDALYLLNKAGSFNDEFYIKRSIIYFSLRENSSALKDLGSVKSDKYKELKTLIGRIYTEKFPPAIKEKKQFPLKEFLKGYYLYRCTISLNELYNDFQENEKLKKLEEARLELFFAKIAIFTILFLFILAGGVIILIMHLARNYKNLWQKRWVSYPIRPGDAWVSFIFWDFLHLLLPFLFLYLGIRLIKAGDIVASYILISLVAVFVILRAAGVNCPKDFEKIGIKFNGWLKNTWIAVKSYAVAVFMVFMVALINSFIFKSISISSNPIFEVIRKTQGFHNMIYLFLLVVLIGPVFEEIVFRGLLYTSFRRTLNVPVSIFLVALIFSFIHGDPAGFLPIFTLGMVLNYTYEKTGTIFTSFILHALWNAGTFFGFMMLIKGNVM